MAITTSGTLSYLTAANQFIWDSQSACGLYFRWRPEFTGAVLNQQAFFLGRASNCSVSMNGKVWTLTSGGGTLQFTPYLYTASAHDSTAILLNLGAVYQVMVSYAQGAQTLYINGVPTALGTLTGNTQSANVPWRFGGGFNDSTVEDIAVWHGYAPTQADALALYFGTSTPSQIGTSATWFGEWPLTGASGATPLVSPVDRGLKCYDRNGVEQPGYDFTTTSGSGTAVYSAPLPIDSNSQLQSAYICTSGKSVACLFNVAGSANLTPVTLCTTPPTLYKNEGGSWICMGQLVNPALVTGKHNCILFSFPPGVSPATAADSFAISAPVGWVGTGAGPIDSVNLQPLANRVGKSSVGADALSPTLPVGVNINWAITGFSGSPGCVEKNLRYRISQWFGCSSQTNDGYPTTLSGTSAWAILVETDLNNNGLDATHYPMATGYYAIGWDDTPTGTTTFSLSDGDSNTTVTHLSQYDNPGANGVGKVAVYQVQYKSGVTDYGSRLLLTVANAATGQNCTFSGLVIYGPGDFTVGTPTVLDRSNPYALSAALLSRLPASIGSLRMMDSTLNSGARSWIVKKEEQRQLTHFSWGSNSYTVSRAIPLVSADPWNSTAYPWAYTAESWGTPFTCTLASNMPTSTQGAVETYTFSDAQNAPTAATGPVIAGLKIKDNGETMRILSVTGTSVQLERGSEGTTPTTHTAGPLSISGRAAITPSTLIHAGVAQITCASPHGLSTGQALPFPNWGTSVHFPFTDGSNPTLATAAYPSFVLSSTVILMWYTGTTTGTTLSSSVNLSSYSCTYSMPGYACVPYEFLALTAASFPKCDCHVNIGYVMDDDCVMDVARRIRDNFPAGRKVWVEGLGDEPWNWAMGNQNPYVNQVSQLIAGSGSFLYEWQVTRSCQIKQLFVNVFNENGLNRGSEIKILINFQKTASALAQSALNYAITNNYVGIDAVSIAPYAGPSTFASSFQDYWNYDNDQVAGDLLSHDLWYNTSGQTQWATSMQAVINAYNAATGGNCVLYGYESGLTEALPNTTTTLTASCASTDTTLQVGSSTNFVVGQYIVVDYPSSFIPTASSELMQITGKPDGTHLTVTRGLTGLALTSQVAVAHGSGAAVRSCAWERDSDIFYNPNYRQCELDTYALYQSVGYYRTNLYSFWYLAQPMSDWTCYWAQGQLPGMGDGTDGLANNRLCLAEPGQTYTKSYTTNLHMTNVSVRGRALLDWMNASGSGRKRPRFVPWRRHR